MANLSESSEKLVLDWICGGATATQPSARYVGLAANGQPNSRGGSEVLPNSGYVRQSGSPLFGAANSPAGTCSNNVALTFGPFSSSCAILGMHVWDTSAFTAGMMLWQGSLQTARTVLPGDTIYFAAGQITCGVT